MASNAIAMVVGDFGETNFPERVIAELRSLGYHGLGDPNVDGGLRSNWNSLDQRAGDPGDFAAALSVQRTTFTIDDVDLEAELSVPGLPTVDAPPDVTLPTELSLELVDLGGPDNNDAIVAAAASQLGATVTRTRSS
ncbi:MAG: hypothetical protein R3C10_28125 [Pirellulales bacterium]